jgi:hypothetical protein
MENHLANRKDPAMTKTKMRRIGKTRAKTNGIKIDIKILIRVEQPGDCQMSCHFSEIARDTSLNLSCNPSYTS